MGLEMEPWEEVGVVVEEVGVVGPAERVMKRTSLRLEMELWELKMGLEVGVEEVVEVGEVGEVHLGVLV